MNRDYLIALLAAIAVMTPGALLWVLGASTSPVLVVTAGAAVAAVLSLNRRWYRRIVARTEAQTVHLRSVVGLAALSGGLPVFWSEHAIAPETLMLIQHLVSSLKIRRVLELGSGLSTTLLAKHFRRAGGGHILSFDDDERWAGLTKATLDREGLASFAEVRVAPLTDVTAGGRRTAWYDLSSLDDQQRFDLIVVDGPPAWKGDSLARLPALYELVTHLEQSGVLVLDDASRPGETAIASRWRRDFPDLHFRMVEIGRGLFVASREKATLDLLSDGD
jgi:predicted O-methyltransferase YrrM